MYELVDTRIEDAWMEDTWLVDTGAGGYTDRRYTG